MKLAVVSRELPHAQGTAIGRELLAWCEGWLQLGHDLDMWLWHRSDDQAAIDLPSWCHYHPFDISPVPSWTEYASSLVKPHGKLGRAGWRPPAGYVGVAAEVGSAPATFPFSPSVATVHNRALADGIAGRALRRWHVQECRAERTAARKSNVVLTYSARVARSLPGNVRVVPVAYPVPEKIPGPVDRPVAYMLADWSWVPNQHALKSLVTAWREVRGAVPGACLLLGGRYPDKVSVNEPGVTFLGPIGSSADVLERASVLAFPCPSSTGPKVKVLEAMSYARAVVTTPWGVEGLQLPEGRGAVVVRPQDFTRALVTLLRSPERRAELGRAARAAIQEHHSSEVAAQARFEVLKQALD